jgi:hypothetical protein
VFSRSSAGRKGPRVFLLQVKHTNFHVVFVLPGLTTLCLSVCLFTPRLWSNNSGLELGEGMPGVSLCLPRKSKKYLLKKCLRRLSLSRLLLPLQQKQEAGDSKWGQGGAQEPLQWQDGSPLLAGCLASNYTVSEPGHKISSCVLCVRSQRNTRIQQNCGQG